MKILIKLLLIFTFILGITFMQHTPAYAMKWNRATIMVYVPNDAPYFSMMQKAIAEWESNTRRKIFFIVTSFDRDKPMSEVDTTFNKVSGENAQNSSSVEFTTTSNNFRHAKIVMDINETPEVINDEEKNKENLDEIYALMLKSVGTMLGLQESDNPQSVMYKEYQEGQTILDNDKENLLLLYGWITPTHHKKR